MTRNVVNNLKNLIAKKGFKLYAVAEMCGYTSKDFYNIMANRKVIREEDIYKICTGLKVTPNELFDYET